MIFQITTSENQKNNNNSNISTIDLGDCEERLKDIYNINKSLPLIIFKIDYISPDTLIPIIGYEIYHPITYLRLNLSYCEDILIKLNIPVSINENNLYKYDPNSGYYTDNCFAYTTEDGTDIILNDRKQEFSDNNLSLCENNCNYTGYDTSTKKSACDCAIKNKMELISEIMDNPDKLSNNFANEDSSSKSSTIITMKCTKTLFTKEGLKSNISSYVLLIIIFFFLLSIVLFIKCGYPLLSNDINKIINDKRKQQKEINKNNIITKGNNNKNIKRKLNSSKRNVVFNLIDNVNISKSKGIKKKSRKQSKKNNFNINNKSVKFSKQKKMKQKPQNNIKNDLISKNIQKVNKKVNNSKITYTIYELNTFNYQLAVSFDRRGFSDYYISLIKTKHPLIFVFCPIDDYNSRIIKIDLFLLSFCIYYVINFAFFSEEIIHEIYEEGGSYNIIYFIPKIVISFAISHIASIILKYIFLSERNIIQIKRETFLSKAENMVGKVKRNLVIKYSLFFVFGLIFLWFFWMLLSSFGVVYQNTQMFVFKNTLISFAMSFIYPLIINIFPGIFRISAINSEKKSEECIYNASKILQLL